MKRFVRSLFESPLAVMELKMTVFPSLENYFIINCFLSHVNYLVDEYIINK